MPRYIPLNATDLRKVKGSGLTDDTILANGLRTEANLDSLASCLRRGRSSRACLPGLLIPYRDLDGSPAGYARVRPHQPRLENGKAVKYEAPLGVPVRPYLPVAGLPHITDGVSPIYITEGELKALALAQLGVAVVGIAGVWAWVKKGTKELSPEVARVPWEGRKIYLVPDHDPNPKTQEYVRVAMRSLATALAKAGARAVYQVDLPAPEGGGKQGVDDYLVAHGEEAFRELVGAARVINEIGKIPAQAAGPGGISLIQLIAPKLGEAAYYGVAGEFLRAVAPYTEATDAGVLAHLLPAAGSLIGPGPHVFAGGMQPARVNTALVGPTSSGRKGTSWVPVRQLLRLADEYFSEHRCVSGLSTGEGLIAAVAGGEGEVEENPITPQEERDPAAAARALYVVEEEFSRVLAQSRREGNVLSQVIRQAFDSGDLRVLTRANPLHAAGAHILITGHITPEELLARLTGIDQANGLGNRFLWFVVRSDKVLPRARPIPQSALRPFARRLWEVSYSASRCVSLDARASRLWADTLYPALREDRPGLAGAVTARGSAIVLRLALIYCLLDEVGRRDTIRVEHLNAAMAVWRYNLDSAYQLFQTKTGSAIGDRILAVLAGGPVKKSAFTDHIARPVAEIDAELGKLVAAGLVTREKAKHAGAGRPAEVYELTSTPRVGN